MMMVNCDVLSWIHLDEDTKECQATGKNVVRFQDL